MKKKSLLKRVIFVLLFILCISFVVCEKIQNQNDKTTTLMAIDKKPPIIEENDGPEDVENFSIIIEKLQEV